MNVRGAIQSTAHDVIAVLEVIAPPPSTPDSPASITPECHGVLLAGRRPSRTTRIGGGVRHVVPPG
jgi:hypothetical protein